MRRLWHWLNGHGVATDIAIITGRTAVWCDACERWVW